MPIFCIDDGGDGTQTDTTQTASTLDWSKADTTIANLIASYPTALTTSGNIIYFGSSTTQTQESALTIVGPTSGLPVLFISADPTNSTPTYQVASADQIITTGTNAITIDGAFAALGMRIKSGAAISVSADGDEVFRAENCYFLPGPAASVTLSSQVGAKTTCIGSTFDCIADSGPTAVAVITGTGASFTEIANCTFANVSNRTGAAISGDMVKEVSGCDFSVFTSTTEAITISSVATLYGCKIGASQALELLNPITQSAHVIAVNCGNTYDVSKVERHTDAGSLYSTPSVSRTGGASIGGQATAWLIKTNSRCSRYAPFYSPWIYGTTTTGTKTFDVFITNDTGDFDNAGAWIEVEYMATSTNPIVSTATDKVAIGDTPTTSPGSVSRDDTTSSWAGGASGFDTYKQRLRTTATIGQAGMYRARVGIGVASIATTRDFYIDPEVTVT
jgi:hypothetical protein